MTLSRLSNSSDNITTKVPMTNLYKQQIVVLYMRFELASAAVICLLSVITVIPNSLLLLTIFRNPSRFFRTVSTSFIVGLAVADLVTGLTTEPFFAAYYFGRYLNTYYNYDTPNQLLRTLYRVGGSISTIAISSSFVIVLALTWSQFVAISYPQKYKVWITKKRATTCVVSSYIYFTVFTMLQFSGISEKTFSKIHLAFHPTLVSILLFVTLLLLSREFRKKMQRTTTLNICPPNIQVDNNTHHHHATNRKSVLERHFTVVTFYLAAILLVSALPHICTRSCYCYCKNFSLKHWAILLIAMRVTDLLLFLKVSLDVFIYAWRLPTYRSAFVQVMKCSAAQGPKVHCARQEHVSDAGEEVAIGFEKAETQHKHLASKVGQDSAL